jgi:hypothetical protein
MLTHDLAPKWSPSIVRAQPQQCRSRRFAILPIPINDNWCYDDFGKVAEK